MNIAAWSKRLDAVLAWLLIALGCVHNFIVAPRLYPALNSAAMWFIAGGMIFWYAGFLNLVRNGQVHPQRQVLLLCALTNVSMLLFAFMYASVRRDGWAADAYLMVGGLLLLCVTTVLDALQAHRGHGAIHR